MEIPRGPHYEIVDPERRWDQALWYAWGREDAGDRRLRDSDHNQVMAFRFADYCKEQAQIFQSQRRTFLPSVQTQYQEFLDRVEERA